MSRGSLLIFSALITSAAGAAVVGGREYGFGESIPVSAAETGQMHRQLVERHAFLASSDGIKWVGAQLSMRAPEDQPELRKQAIKAQVIFHPYAQSHGIKHAALATCWRWPEEHYWDCTGLENRDYVRLESQEFEVRLVGDIAFDTAVILRQVTQSHLRSLEGPGETVPAAMTSVSRYREGAFLVSWGKDSGESLTTLTVELVDREHPNRRESWKARVLQPGDTL